MYDGAMYAAGHGASIVRFRHNDPEHLAELLDDAMYPSPRVIAGVYRRRPISITVRSA